MSILEERPGDEIDREIMEIIDFAVAFTSLRRSPQGKLRMPQGAGDLVHTLGYYCEQRRRGENPVVRLTKLATAMEYIAKNLTKD